MILSDNDIIKARKKKDIIIEPWDEDCLNPNSYDLHLNNKLLYYPQFPLDVRGMNLSKEITIYDDGFLMEPGVLYLGSTIEWTETYDLVPMIEGKSSLGRLGLFVHITAGFGDNGFRGRWTLEFVATHPTRIYPGMRICQLFFHTLKSKGSYYDGKYKDSRSVVPSRSFSGWK